MAFLSLSLVVGLLLLVLRLRVNRSGSPSVGLRLKRGWGVDDGRRRWGPPLNHPQHIPDLVELAADFTNVGSLLLVHPRPGVRNLVKVDETRAQDSLDDVRVRRLHRKAKNGVRSVDGENGLGVVRRGFEVLEEVIDDFDVAAHQGTVECSPLGGVALLRLCICESGMALAQFKAKFSQITYCD